MDTFGTGVERGLTHQLERLFANGTATGLSEEQLLDRFTIERDGSAFEALLDRHGPMVLGVCRQFLRDPNDVDDAFQATFLVLVRKAASLRRKDLLGNWLYGVACRVALRSRSVGIRRQTTVALSERLEGLPCAGGSRFSEPVSETVLRDEERPLVHEEVNRLPRKYRTPIVLCYFEGLTHDQAAARLGWPVGTVKGRLSRARDLLRTRLSRRGVSVASTALAAHLAGSELKASVPASLTSLTLNAALWVAARHGAAITASSAVSLPVASLTEGVLHTMILSQIKSIVIPFLVAAGVLTTGASVVALQGGVGSSSRPRQNRPNDPHAAASTNAPILRAGGVCTRSGGGPTRSPDSRRPAKINVGSGQLNDPESYHTWSLRLLEAEKRETPENSPPIAACEGHLQRMTRMLQSGEVLAKAGRQSSYDLARWKYFAKEAERMLEEAKGAATMRRHAGPYDGRNDGRMSGASMMRGAMGSMGAATGNIVAQPAEKPSTAAAATNPGQAQPQPKPQGGDLGGGFGGGFDSSGTDEQIARLRIARMSAALSRLDKNPKNIAVIKKLEEPMALHFPTATPLEEILNHVKEATKGSDGKRLSIYVDPLALQEAEKTLESPVVIDLEDVPLRLSLRLVLKQLGLAYCVREGVVMISTIEGIKQELEEARAEQMGLNPENYRLQAAWGMGMGGMGRPGGMM